MLSQAIRSEAAYPRVDVDLDSGWRFIRQDVSGAQNTGFDDSAWATVNVPHTWNNLDGEDGGNNYYRGVGWYRRHYAVDAGYAGQHFFLKFDGTTLVTDVYLNGNYLGQHRGGYAAFVFDVTPYINMGGDNVIAVKVNNAFVSDVPPLEVDFNIQGGILRDVHLLVTDAVHISPLDYGSPGVYLKPTAVSAASANLDITALVSNATAAAETVGVVDVLEDAASNVVQTLSNSVTLSPQSISNVVSSTVMMNPHLWNGLADPYVYTATVQVWRDGTLVDAVSQPLGFRWFSVDANQGFSLNGRPYPLHGVCMHDDWLDRGSAVGHPERLTNFALIREIGATAVRLAHWQHTEDTYQLADQNGIVVETEVPLIDYITESTAFYNNAKQQLIELIRQNYNHPCIFFWGIFNEITQHSGPSSTNLDSQLAQLAAQEDPTRVTSAASATTDASDPTDKYSSVLGFNRYYGWYTGTLDEFAWWIDSVHSSAPAREIGMTEYGAGASIYQHSEDPVSEPVAAGPFHPEEWQNLVHESQWQQMKTRPYLWGTFVWNMFDFASDSRNEGDTPGRNDKGLVTYDRKVRKDAFYWYKANWTTNPMVYITGHTFTNRTATNITAKMYANCDTVELFQNGVSRGARTSTNRIYTWPVTLVAGGNTMQAVGTSAGVQVSDTLRWIGPGTAPVITRPILSYQSLEGAMQLSWQSNGGSWHLQCCADPVPGGQATAWADVPAPVTNPFVAPFDPGMHAMLYRLVLTNW